MEKITKETVLNTSAMVRFLFGLGMIYVAMNPVVINRLEANESFFFPPMYFLALVSGISCYLVYLSISRRNLIWIVLGLSMIIYMRPFEYRELGPWSGPEVFLYYPMAEFRNIIGIFGMLLIVSVPFLREKAA